MMFTWTVFALDVLKLLLEFGIKLLDRDRRKPKDEPDEHEPELVEDYIKIPKRRASDRTTFEKIWRKKK